MPDTAKSQRDEAILRDPPSGKIIGFIDENAHAWLGIPYAKPPIGPLRWRAPQKIPRWSGEHSALKFGPKSIQSPPEFISNGSEAAYSEDCLYLNIWSPAFTRNKVPYGKNRLPVMVWLHGGGNVFGASSSYSGSRLSSSQSVIVVSLNYRLGAFGWLYCSRLHDNDSTAEDRSGNYGTLDIICALNWIKDNISAFGGNPDCVTIFGESGGAWNVSSLLVSPKAADLFHRAIIQSNSLSLFAPAEAENLINDSEPGHPQSSSELLVQLLIQDSKATDRSAAILKMKTTSNAEIATYLRSKTYEEIESAYIEIGKRNYSSYQYCERLNRMKLGALGSTFSVPKLFSDGAVLSKGDFKDLFSSGNFHRVPIIIGSTRDEDKAFLVFDSKFVDKSPNLPLKIKDTDRFNLAADYLSKLWKAEGVDERAVAISKFQVGKVFSYRFDWDEQPIAHGIDFSLLMGACHGAELGFVFGGVKYLIGPEVAAARIYISDENSEGVEYLTEAMMSYWAQFAYSGEPGRGRRGKLPLWKSWSPEPTDSKMLILDTPRDGGIRMSSEWITREKVFLEIEDDIRLRNPVKKKQLYEDIFNYFITRLTSAELSQLLAGKK